MKTQNPLLCRYGDPAAHSQPAPAVKLTRMTGRGRAGVSLQVGSLEPAGCQPGMSVRDRPPWRMVRLFQVTGRGAGWTSASAGVVRPVPSTTRLIAAVSTPVRRRGSLVIGRPSGSARVTGSAEREMGEAATGAPPTSMNVGETHRLMQHISRCSIVLNTTSL